MRTSRSSRALLAAFAALGGFLSFANAQSVATAPVGAVSVSVSANSDQPIGVTLQRPVIFASATSAVSGAVLTVPSVPSLGSQAKYVKFLTGVAVGQWVQVASSTSTTITLTESAQALGVVATDKFEVRPFWTTSTLFPVGSGFPVSTDLGAPKALLYLYNSAAVGVNISAAASYFYYAGDVDFPAGWYNGDFELANDALISPETFISINNSTATVAKVVSVGDVPTVQQVNTVVSRVAGEQDNLVYNPYPSDLTLGASGLHIGGVVRPTTELGGAGDTLYLYSTSSSGLNPSASASFFYFAGEAGFPAGWYNGDFESADSVSIPAGAAIIIRKTGGVSTASDWKPSTPYSL